jgi:hypothetical protein
MIVLANYRGRLQGRTYGQSQHGELLLMRGTMCRAPKRTGLPLPTLSRGRARTRDGTHLEIFRGSK